MAQRRTLTPEERRASEAFAAKVPERGSHQVLADRVGVTPAAIGHWSRGEIPIPLRRAPAVAAALGVSPGEICVEWRVHVEPFLAGAVGPSQPARLNVPTVANTTQALRTFLGRRGIEYDPIEHAGLFVAVYHEAEKLSAQPSQEELVSFASTVADVVHVHFGATR